MSDTSGDKDDSVNRDIRAYYAAKKLVPGENLKQPLNVSDRTQDLLTSTESLLHRVESADTNSKNTGRSAESTFKRQAIFAVAATVMLVVASSVLFQHQWTINDRTELALREASMNHVTKLNFDFTPNEVAELESEMKLLHFALRIPNFPELAQLRIEGARYCTLGGNLAAHLKFRHRKTSELFSLFLTPDHEKLKFIRDTPASKNGVDVKLWRENGLFYAMARSGATASYSSPTLTN